jgi:hypothetical protein
MRADGRQADLSRCRATEQRKRSAAEHLPAYTIDPRPAGAVPLNIIFTCTGWTGSP